MRGVIVDAAPELDALRRVIDASPVAMLAARDGRVVFANGHVEQLFGYERDELRGVEMARLAPGQLASASESATMSQSIPRLLRDRGRGAYGVRKDGRPVPIELRHSTFVARGGALTLCSIADLTERHHDLELFRRALEASPSGVLISDADGVIVLVNAQIEQMFGYRRDELVGHPVERLVPEASRPAHAASRASFGQTPNPRPMGRVRELFGVRRDGSLIPVEIALNPFTTSDGELVLCSVVDITERRRAEREREAFLATLKETLKEREVLLQEIHHRVKNNLQVISSLINMQARNLGPGSSQDALQECQTRVLAIALIHEKLYQSKDYADVRFAEYARGLAGNVFRAMGTAPGGVALELQVDDIPLGIDRAIPCGLVINELITNALKHGFRGNRGGTIWVGLTRVAGERLKLWVRDDGPGLPSGFAIATASSMGLRVVTTLCRQLDATLEIGDGPGASFALIFPEKG